MCWFNIDEFYETNFHFFSASVQFLRLKSCFSQLFSGVQQISASDAGFPNFSSQASTMVNDCDVQQWAGVNNSARQSDANFSFLASTISMGAGVQPQYQWGPDAKSPFLALSTALYQWYSVPQLDANALPMALRPGLVDPPYQWLEWHRPSYLGFTIL